MVPFDRTHAISYYSSIATMSVSCIVSEILSLISQTLQRSRAPEQVQLGLCNGLIIWHPFQRVLLNRTVVILVLIIRLETRLHFTARFGGVHAVGSAESEPI